MVKKKLNPAANIQSCGCPGRKNALMYAFQHTINKMWCHRMKIGVNNVMMAIETTAMDPKSSGVASKYPKQIAKGMQMAKINSVRGNIIGLAINPNDGKNFCPEQFLFWLLQRNHRALRSPKPQALPPRFQPDSLAQLTSMRAVPVDSV
ncbi:MAG: hypothetical protein AB1813_08720 [Verrucomicrobiota bacterium]